MDCLITAAAAGLCPQCGDDMEPAHIVERPVLSLSCARCCPVHGMHISGEWDGEAATIAGTQESLF